jgi:hypothetical protein
MTSPFQIEILRLGGGLITFPIVASKGIKLVFELNNFANFV